MPKYPTIIIPNLVISKKNSPNLHCLPTNMKPNYESRRHCHGTMRPMISDDISKAEKNTIITYMRRSWGMPTIMGPVNANFLFFIAKYPTLPMLAGRDLSNSYQLYEDLMQADIYKVPKNGQFANMEVLASSGAGIIKNDSLIQGHEGSRFVYLCYDCTWGITGTRRSPIRNKTKTGCPGVKSCPDQRIEITITDMVLNEEGFYGKSTKR